MIALALAAGASASGVIAVRRKPRSRGAFLAFAFISMELALGAVLALAS